MNSKLLLLCLVTMTALSVSALPTEPCTATEIDKLTPDTQNCSRFYECTRDGWVGEACNPGLEFNPDTLYCDYPANVHCATAFVEQTTEPCTVADVDKLIPDAQNCSRFYECTLGGWVGLPCPAGLEFNPDTLYCDYPANVNCAKEIV